MKLLKFFALLLICAGIYGTAASYMPLRDGNVAVVEEKKTGAVAALLEGERLFVPYRAFFWIYEVYVVSTGYSVTGEIKINIPEIEPLKDKAYKILLPVSYSFQILPSDVKDLNLFKENGNIAKEKVFTEITNAFGAAMQNYLSPVYRGREAAAGRDIFLAAVAKSAEQKLSGEGIRLTNIDYSGAVYFPEDAIYREGLAHLAELRKIIEENDKRLLAAKGDLDIDAKSMERKYQVYKDISQIIKENPDILKYIYIDKMAGNLKLIITSDTNAVPAFLDKPISDKGKSERGSGEINNLEK